MCIERRNRMFMDEFELLSEIARLYYDNNMTQSEIAKQVHTSRSTVSRLLQEARDKRIVEITIHYPWDRSPQLEQQLLNKFNLKDIRVLETRGRQAEEALRGVGVLAARYLESNITEHTILGMSWGRTVYSTVEMLKPGKNLPIKVVQLFGAAIPKSRVDGSDLVRRVASIYGGEYYYIHAPLSVRSLEAKSVLIRDPHIKETLMLAEKADIILTGIGSLEPAYSPSRTWISYLSKEEISMIRKKGAVGHICAYHFDKTGQVLDISHHQSIIGVDIELLKRVPLVVGVASGQEKANAVLGALNGRLINVLITDDTTAQLVLNKADIK